MKPAKLTPVKRYDDSAGYDVMVDGVKVAHIYRSQDRIPIMASDGRYEIGYRTPQVWRVADRIKRPNGEWCYASGLTWRTRKSALEFVLAVTGNAA